MHEHLLLPGESPVRSAVEMPLVFFESHCRELIEALGSADWTNLVSVPPSDEMFVCPRGPVFAEKMHQFLSDLAYGYERRIDRGPWIAANLDKLLGVFSHVVCAAMATADASLISAFSEEGGVEECRRDLDKAIYSELGWPRICGVNIHIELFRSLRSVIDYFADGPGFGACENLGDPSEIFASVTDWVTSITIPDASDQITVARFGDGHRAIFLHTNALIRLQSQATGSPIETLGHPLLGRTSANLLRIFSLLDDRDRPIGTLYADDLCLAFTIPGRCMAPNFRSLSYELVVSCIVRLLELKHGTDDLENTYRHQPPDGTEDFEFILYSQDYFEDQLWSVTAVFSEGKIQSRSQHAIEICKKELHWRGPRNATYTIEYYENNVRHRLAKPAVLDAIEVAWFENGVEIARMDSAEYYESVGELSE